MQDHDTGRHGIERAVGSGGFRTQVVSSPQSSTLSSSLEIPLRSGLSIPRPSTSMQQKKSKMHKCQKCDKMFPRISALATHMNTHSGAKPYERTVSGCDTRFAPRANARRHLRTHGIDPSSFDNAPSGPAFMAGFDEPLTTQVHDTGKQPSRYRWIPQTLSSRPTDRLSPGSSSTVAEVPLRARHISSYPVASSVVSGPSQTAQMTTTSPQLPYSPLNPDESSGTYTGRREHSRWAPRVLTSLSKVIHSAGCT
ncbi:hypothetical protein PAXINDRAFT_167862 [Paxillus involutus ATCC 200175]|nr:hypothetical protein PAXINDRAFT_167862 [Paxillus involutus ATCC 200175]